MSVKTETALELFDNGFNCAQSVVGAFCENLGTDRSTALKFAGSFGGGMRSGEVCGAVTGALMVIGLRYGQNDPEDRAAKEKCGQVTLQFMDEYRNRQSTLLCREILGYDVRDPEARAKNPGRQKEVCPKAIEAAVLLLEEMGF